MLPGPVGVRQALPTDFIEIINVDIDVVITVAVIAAVMIPVIIMMVVVIPVDVAEDSVGCRDTQTET
jgi:hypothetical protein